MATLLAAQPTRKSIALSDKSNIPAKEVFKTLEKECPNISLTDDASKSDYTLEAIKHTDPNGGVESFDLTLFDHEGRPLRKTSTMRFSNAAKDVCHAIKTAVVVEVVDTENLTQSSDQRGDTSGGAVGAVVHGLTGRRTHTDVSTIRVVVNGEHALLDCYERRTGCTTISPGKYYGELDGDSIWVTYEMPITHKQVRNHYKIAGSW